MKGDDNGDELPVADARAAATSSITVADKNLLKELVEAKPSGPSRIFPKVACRL